MAVYNIMVLENLRKTISGDQRNFYMNFHV